ncbi:MAG: mannose-1-phosphate guanylyltransferase/mannose-6-phosphate isomerase [Alphaproteobacteria bacterium]
MSIHPVILSGGSGTRLWPLSRKHFPKQLLALSSEHTLLQETLKRVSGNGYQPPVVICNTQHRFIVAEQIRDSKTDVNTVILEHIGRNTAPAAAVAALVLAEEDPDAIILMLPSDHIIENGEAFAKAVETATLAAQNGHLVTFGIEASNPETGYGYILRGAELDDAPGAYKVDRFIEKPDLDKAQEMLDAGGHSWNSGMFLFRADSYLDELKRLQPEIFDTCSQAVAANIRDIDFRRLDEEIFEKCPSLSIDYAVMEHTGNAAVVPVDIGWNDIGAWSAMWEISDKDADGNVLKGDVVVAESSGNYLQSSGPLIAALGLTDMVVVMTDDAVLVTTKDHAQNVGVIVDELKKKNRVEHLYHTRVRRPWGWYQTLDTGDAFQVKRIYVNPGARLSLQRHKRRAEHWVVVSGQAQVHCDGKDMTLTANQSVYVPIGAAHRLENPTDEALFLIEVQSGDYLGEDDIERLEDDYKRDPQE